MRFERMVIEAGSNTFTLSLHPRLTVIAGLGKVERDALTGELIGALGSSRAGVHLELVQDDGRRIAVFRPEGARHRVVDIDAAADVTAEFTDVDGRLDVLARYGLDARSARRGMRLTAADLRATIHSGDLIRHLAEADQTELWSAAARVRVTDDALQAEAEAVGSAPEDAEAVEQVEQRHREVEAATETHSRLRQRAVLIGAASCVIGVPVTALNPPVAAPILAIGLIANLLAMLYRRRVDRAAEAEAQALSEAGAESYLGFHLQRVNGLLSNDQSRRRLMAAADDHREASARWAAVAGDVGVDWALEHHEEIAAAAKLRRDMRNLGAMSSTAPDVDGDVASSLAHTVVHKLAKARSLGSDGESFPLLVDEALGELDDTVKPALLELLSRSAGSPQVVVLTADEDVASWARLEALTGDLRVVEPTPEHEARPTSAV